MPDPRARHYWDGDRVMGRAYRVLQTATEAIDLGTEAWDTYLLFDRDATWDTNGPPRAAWWEHQLQSPPPELLLDPKRFARKAAELRSKLAATP